MRRWLLTLGSGLLACAAASADVTVRDIGSLNGRPSMGFGINAAGDVAGFSFFAGTIGQIGGPPSDPFLGHAVLFADGTLTDLGALEGKATCSPLGCESRGLDINGKRWIAGWSDGDLGLLAVVWLPAAFPGGTAGFNVLPGLSSEFSSVAFALNDDGVIVGRSSRDPIGPRAVRWTWSPEGPQIEDLGTLRPDGEGYGTAYGVNARGEIAGTASTQDGFLKGFLYLPAPAYGLPAGMNDLMTGVDAYGHAAGINDRGEVAGEIDLGVPWIWLPEPAYGLPAGLSLIPLTRTIVAFFPNAISDAGQIVGQAYVETNPRTGAFERKAALWRNGRWTLLDDLLPARSPWTFLEAVDIVRVGKITRITGQGTLDGVTDVNGITPAARGYMLEVTCTGDLDDDGDVDEADLAWQRALLGTVVAPGTDGDLDGDGDVDAQDVGALARQVHAPCL